MGRWIKALVLRDIFCTTSVVEMQKDAGAPRGIVAHSGRHLPVFFLWKAVFVRLIQISCWAMVATLLLYVHSVQYRLSSKKPEIICYRVDWRPCILILVSEKGVGFLQSVSRRR